MPGFIGPLELIVALVVLALVFGARRVPQVGRAAGAALHGFRKESTGRDDGQLDRITRQAAEDTPPRV